jgi:tetratricopeptide (TPR) repeat protein
MAYYRIGVIRLTQWGDWVGSLDMSNRAVEYSANATEWERLLISGTNHWKRGRLDEALNSYSELVEKYPEEKEGYRSLATFYRVASGHRDIERSIGLTMQIIELDSLDFNAYNRLAYDYDQIGNYEKSIAAINTYIERNPGKPNPLDSRAELYANNGQIQQSLESYLQVIEIDPNFASAYNGAFAMYVYLGQLANAERMIARMDSHPDSDIQKNAVRRRGQLALYKGQFKSALRIFDVLDQQPESREELSPHMGLLQNARWIYSYIGDHERSLQMAERYYELSHDVDTTGASSAWALGSLVGQARMAGQLDRMDSLFRERTARFERLEITPPPFASGRMALAHGQGDSAVHYFELWSEGRRNCAHLFWLGQAYAAAERTREAVGAFEDALERYDRSRWFNPIQSTRLHFLLAKAYEKAGRTDKAAEQYRMFLELWKDADTEVEEIRYAKRRLTQLGA